MGRKGRIQGTLLSILAAIFGSCSQEEPSEDTAIATVSIALDIGTFETRSGISDEDTVHDLNLLIFDEKGRTHMSLWQEDFRSGSREVTLDQGHTFSFYAFANFGEEIRVSSVEDLAGISVETKEQGIPMTARAQDIMIEDGMSIGLVLTRLSAKISLRMDRSLLDDDVTMKVVRASIGNSPKYIPLIGVNRAETRYDCTERGHTLETGDCEGLNTIGKGGLSDEVRLYVPENMQGNFPFRISEDEEKVFDAGDPMADICSYIELEMEYSSDALISYDNNLIYRFYLGDGLDNLDVERNCHYRITVTPEGDGLSGGGWRVDKSGIGPSVPYFTMHPGEYIEGHVGDTLRVWCDYYPGSAPFDPGYEELDFDRSRGIYDYTVDMQKKEVTLILKKPGTGILYMSAGEPVSMSGMAFLEVYP